VWRSLKKEGSSLGIRRLIVKKSRFGKQCADFLRDLLIRGVLNGLSCPDNHVNRLCQMTLDAPKHLSESSFNPIADDRAAHSPGNDDSEPGYTDLVTP
jgi:hypothetical protein